MISPFPYLYENDENAATSDTQGGRVEPSDAPGSFAMDHLQVMLTQERSYGVRVQPYDQGIQAPKSPSSVTSSPSSVTSIDELNYSWRRRIAEWAYEVVDHFGFDREVVSVSLDYLDRFVSKTTSSGKRVGKKEFQLIAVTCLYLAIKLHGEVDLAVIKSRRKLRISTFVELSHGLFSAEMIEETERAVLSLLSWRVNPPTSVRFLSHILHYFVAPCIHDMARKEVVTAIFEVSRYLAEMAVCVSEISVARKASVIALATLVNAINAAESASIIPQDVRRDILAKLSEITRYNLEAKAVEEAREELSELCPNVSSLFQSAEDLFIPDFQGTPGGPTSREVVSESISGKRSPDCVSGGLDENFPEHHTKRRHSPGNPSNTSTTAFPSAT